MALALFGQPSTAAVPLQSSLASARLSDVREGSAISMAVSQRSTQPCCFSALGGGYALITWIFNHAGR